MHLQLQETHWTENKVAEFLILRSKTEIRYVDAYADVNVDADVKADADVAASVLRMCCECCECCGQLMWVQSRRM